MFILFRPGISEKLQSTHLSNLICEQAIFIVS